jgi:hypothetical protein
LPALGEGLPPGSRLLIVRKDAPGVAHGTLIAFVPCGRFERDGLYVIRVPSGFELRNCRALERGRGIEVASPSGRQDVAEDSFRGLVEGRVIGIALVEVSEETKSEGGTDGEGEARQPYHR